MKEDLLFENSLCFVVNKKCGEDSQDLARGFFAVHRLDKPVSGCQLIAKDKETAAYLSDLFARQDDPAFIDKRYWAVVEKPQLNLPLPADGNWIRLEHNIKFDPKQNKSFADDREGQGGKKASLRYRLAGSGDNYLFLEIMLLSGRHHQIRAQLAALGLHIKGDLKYGAKRSEKGGGIRLHARSLAFPNPLNREEILRVEAPLHEPDPLWQAFENEELGIRS